MVEELDQILVTTNQSKQSARLCDATYTEVMVVKVSQEGLSIWIWRWWSAGNGGNVNSVAGGHESEDSGIGGNARRQ